MQDIYPLLCMLCCYILFVSFLLRSLSLSLSLSLSVGVGCVCVCGGGGGGGLFAFWGRGRCRAEGGGVNRSAETKLTENYFLQVAN